MCPCTLHSRKTGTIGTMCPKLGTIFPRGEGRKPSMISETCPALGTIGTIGTMFSTYARARGCGVCGAAASVAQEKEKDVSAYRSKTSSLSSLSSPRGVFTLKDQRFAARRLLEKIVPDFAEIVPIVPKGKGLKLNAASGRLATTTY